MRDRFVHLLRHGEPENGGRFRGKHDDPLSEDGFEQMMASLLGVRNFDHVITSPSARCSQFSKAVAEGMKLPYIESPAFAERHFGDWENKHVDDIPAEDLKAFWENPRDFTPPGAEPFDQFVARCARGWKDIIEHDTANPLIVTHGGVIRAIIGDVLSIPMESLILLEVPYASYTAIRIPIAPGKPSLMTHRSA